MGVDDRAAAVEFNKTLVVMQKNQRLTIRRQLVAVPDFNEMKKKDSSTLSLQQQCQKGSRQTANLNDVKCPEKTEWV